MHHLLPSSLKPTGTKFSPLISTLDRNTSSRFNPPKENMKIPKILKLFVLILITLTHSQAKPDSKNTIFHQFGISHTVLDSNPMNLSILITTPSSSQSNFTKPDSKDTIFQPTHNSPDRFRLNRTILRNTQMNLTAPVAIAGVLCFVASSISSAGGIGGGGLFIPILIIVAGLDLKTASSFSAFMVTGSSIANVLCQMVPKFGGKNLIDYDIALLSEPFMLLGVSVGVICNRIFPEWLITTLFAVFLAWSTFKTCKSGVLFWKLETEDMRNGFQNSENGLARIENSENEEVDSTKEPLLSVEIEKGFSGIPWTKLGVLVMIWFSFLALYLLRGNKYGQGIIPIKLCGLGYWLLSALQIPLAIIFTTWILYRKEGNTHEPLNNQEKAYQSRCGPSSKLIFPIMALLAGVLGGVFGIGGGMLISPLLLQVDIPPEITAATCSFMVFFSATMSAIQYLLLGMEHIDSALVFALICFVASLVGLVAVQRAIEKHGRASLIVFSVSTVMALSTVLITSFGALDVWRDYNSGNYMGFKRPC